MTLTISDGLLVLSTLVAPFLAVFVQRRLDIARESRQRRDELFRRLMATRGTVEGRLSPQHVEALNMIDIVFFTPKPELFQPSTERGDTRVRTAWKIHREHILYVPSYRDEDERRSVDREWSKQYEENLVGLLSTMSDVLGYRFDQVDLRKGTYTPEAHGRDAELLEANRAAVNEILIGKRAIPVMVYTPPQATAHGNGGSGSPAPSP